MARSQTHFRWRADDGGEASATWLAAEDVPISLARGSQCRLRVGVAMSAGIGSPVVYKLQVSKNGGAHQDVTTSSTVVRAVGTLDGYANHDPTTSQLTAVGTFTAGTIQSQDGSTTSLAYVSGGCYDLEWCLLAANENEAGDQLQFRVVISTGAALDTYSETPVMNLLPSTNQAGTLGRIRNRRGIIDEAYLPVGDLSLPPISERMADAPAPPCAIFAGWFHPSVMLGPAAIKPHVDTAKKPAPLASFRGPIFNTFSWGNIVAAIPVHAARRPDYKYDFGARRR